MKWTNAKEETFLNIINEYLRGNVFTDNGFSAADWTAILTNRLTKFAQHW